MGFFIGLRNAVVPALIMWGLIGWGLYELFN